MSRYAARREVRGAQLHDQLEAAGVRVRARSLRGLAEEVPVSYNDVDVGATCERTRLAGRVARLEPIRVVKG